MPLLGTNINHERQHEPIRYILEEMNTSSSL